MIEVLHKIEQSIPVEIKADFRRSICTGWHKLSGLSNQLKQMVNNYADIKEILFKNNENALYYCGDILAKTLFIHWYTNSNIQDTFIDCANSVYEYSNTECYNNNKNEFLIQ